MGSLPRLLVVDDEPRFTADLMLVLAPHFSVGAARNGSEALDLVDSLDPDVVLLDIRLGDGADGFEILAKLRMLCDPPEVLMLTEDHSASSAVRALKSGAFHYLVKSASSTGLVNLCQIAAAHRLARRRALAADEAAADSNLVAADSASLRVVRDLDRVAPTETTVLLIGETGTGKEICAKRIHDRSRRRNGPFFAVNCGGIADSLVESELQGCKRGAYTGADAARQGYVGRARGGTLFLDEIGNASMTFQRLVLRLLESREFFRVGSDTPETADVRIIAASSDDLAVLCTDGRFLESLYHRLCVYRIDLPPLRERRDDIKPLAHRFLAEFAMRMGRNRLEFDDKAIEFLCGNDWSGNVRQLRNVIERAVIDCRTESIGILDLVAGTLDPVDLAANYEDARTRSTLQFKRMYIAGQLRRHDGDTWAAAKASGLSRRSFLRMMADCGVTAMVEDEKQMQSRG